MGCVSNHFSFAHTLQTETNCVNMFHHKSLPYSLQEDSFFVFHIIMQLASVAAVKAVAGLRVNLASEQISTCVLAQGAGGLGRNRCLEERTDQGVPLVTCGRA